MAKQDFYELLGVSKEASAEEIRRGVGQVRQATSDTTSAVAAVSGTAGDLAGSSHELRETLGHFYRSEDDSGAARQRRPARAVRRPVVAATRTA